MRAIGTAATGSASGDAAGDGARCAAIRADLETVSRDVMLADAVLAALEAVLGAERAGPVCDGQRLWLAA